MRREMDQMPDDYRGEYERVRAEMMNPQDEHTRIIDECVEMLELIIYKVKESKAISNINWADVGDANRLKGDLSDIEEYV